MEWLHCRSTGPASASCLSLGVLGSFRIHNDLVKSSRADSRRSEWPGRGGGGVDTEARINSSEHKVLQLLPADTPPLWKVEADSVPILS